jgi:hypothetical protein
LYVGRGHVGDLFASGKTAAEHGDDGPCGKRAGA